MNARFDTANMTSNRKYRYEGLRLRWSRKYLGYSRAQVSSALSIEQSQLAAIEIGIRKANNEFLAKFSRLYGRPVDWLASNAKLDSVETENPSSYNPWQFSEEDRLEFRSFRQVIESTSWKVKFKEKVEALSSLFDRSACVEEVHESLNTFETALRSGYVDIFEAISGVGVATIFRPLGFLGALFGTDKCSGLMLSVSKSLNELRLAAASALARLTANNLHEELTLTKLWYSLSPENELRETDEKNFRISLNLLLPNFLLVETQKRFNWSNRDMASPINMYQASLRLGASYSATTIAYCQLGVISELEAKKLLNESLVNIKQAILQNYLPDNIKDINVWLLTRSEEGSVIRANPNDVFVIKLKENRAAGYRWDFSKLEKEGFSIINDESLNLDAHRVGALSLRSVLANPATLREGDLVLEESCPWERVPTEPNEILVPYRRLPQFKIGLYGSESLHNQSLAD